MFQFPGCSLCNLCIQLQMPQVHLQQVFPFGNPRIKGCLLLPEAYRSLPRPSSPTSAKASTVRPYSLDHIIVSAILITNYALELHTRVCDAILLIIAWLDTILKELCLIPFQGTGNVEVNGFEPMTYCVQGSCSPS